MNGLRFAILFCCCLPQLLSAQWPAFTDVSQEKGITDIESIAYLYGHGAAIADYDTDGDLDFFLCTETNIPNRLYVNNGDGSFTNRSAELGLDALERTRTALWFDYDGDADLDLVTISDCYLEGCNQPITLYLFQQQSNGSFTEIARNIGLEVGDEYDTNLSIAGGGLSAGDLNNDGYLDLIVSIWGGPVSYFENSTTGAFVNKSISSLIGPDFQYRWQPMIYDFDGDGLRDVYINVDFEPNELWINNGDGTFTDRAEETLSNSAYNEMGLTMGDYDNDGDMDLYATNISRVDDGVLRHNILLKNLQSSIGDLLFDEVANDVQVGASGWDWGTTFFDVNNDGLLDLCVTNGWEPRDSPDQSRLWLNLGDGLFGDISNTSLFTDTYNATSLLAFDMDRDGDLDLLQTLKRNPDTDAPLILYENDLTDTPSPGNYIVIKPRSEEVNHFAIGAMVYITSGSTTQMRLITAGTSLYGQEPAEAFFGTGGATVLSEVKVVWPDQSETIIKDVATNQVLTILKESLSTPETESMALRYYPNPVSEELRIDLSAAMARMEICNALGQVMLVRQLQSGENRIALQQLSSGMYWVRVTGAGVEKTAFTIVKE